MPKRIEHSQIKIDVYEQESGFQIAKDFYIPNNLPPVLWWVGAHVIFPPYEIPPRWRSNYLLSTSDFKLSERLVVMPYISVNNGNPQIVIITGGWGAIGTGAQHPNVVTIDYPFSDYPFRLYEGPPLNAAFIEDMITSNVNTGDWLAGAFSFITYDDNNGLLVLWVCALIVKNASPALNTGSITNGSAFLYVVAYPLNRSLSPAHLLLHFDTGTTSYQLQNFSHQFLPIAPTRRGLIVPCLAALAKQPGSVTIAYNTDHGIDFYLYLLRAFASDSSLDIIIYRQGFPKWVLKNGLFHSEQLNVLLTNKFDAILPTTYEGIYYIFNPDTLSFSSVNVSTPPIERVPQDVFSSDGSLLLASQFHALGYTTPTAAYYPTRVLEPAAYILAVTHNNKFLIKNTILPFSKLEDPPFYTGTFTEARNFLFSPLWGTVCSRRAIIFHYDTIYFVDIENNVATPIVKTYNYSLSGAWLPFHSIAHSSPFIARYYPSTLPYVTSFIDLTSERLIFNTAVAARPSALPDEGSTVIPIFLRTAFGDESGADSWGRVLFLEKRFSDFFSIEDATISVTSDGRVAIAFTPPVIGAPHTILVENPPHPYVTVGPPDTRYIIADSAVHPEMFEIDLSGTGNWKRGVAVLQRRSPTEAPFKVRVTVTPKYSQYVRIFLKPLAG